MEGAGVSDILPCIVIKAVCDYADSHKNKDWQKYAAATAASCMKAFLGGWSPVPLRSKEPAAWLVPFHRNPYFVGRGSELEILEKNLFATGNVSKYSIFGLGGVGKTQIGLELAYRTKEKHPDCSVFWVPSVNADSLHQAFFEIGQKLNIPGTESKEADIKLVTKYLSQDKIGQWLIIFDNADDVDVWFARSGHSPPLIDYVPRSSQGRAVLTTRDENSAIKFAKKNLLRLNQLDEVTGVRMLQNLLIRDHVMEDNQSTVQLLKQLCFLPLAISQAAAYLNENYEWTTIKDYLDLLSETEESLIEMLTEDFEDDGRYPHQKNPVATTWLISFQNIKRRRPLAADYLSFIACVEPEAIPISLLPPARSKRDHLEALSTLTAYSFVSKRRDEFIDVHRLVHAATQSWLKINKSHLEWIKNTRTQIAVVFPSEPEYKNKQTWRLYLPHAIRVLSLSSDADLKESSLLHQVGVSLYEEARYSEAEELFTRAIKLKISLLGADHQETFTCMHELAIIYWSQGKLDKVAELGTQVVQMSRKLHGAEDLKTLASMNSLAVIYRDQGRYNEAAELGKQALELRKRVLGAEHPDTLGSMSNLAVIYRDQGRYNEAEELALEVLELQKKMLGAEHPETLYSMNHLAMIYRDQGRYNESEELGQQALELRKRVLGAEHLDTLRSMNNLAMVYRDQGRYDEAEELGQQALELQKKVLEVDHLDTLKSIENVAVIWWFQRPGFEAQEMMTECVRLSKGKLGVHHPETKDRIQILDSWG